LREEKAEKKKEFSLCSSHSADISEKLASAQKANCCIDEVKCILTRHRFRSLRPSIQLLIYHNRSRRKATTFKSKKVSRMHGSAAVMETLMFFSARVFTLPTKTPMVFKLQTSSCHSPLKIYSKR